MAVHTFRAFLQTIPRFQLGDSVPKEATVTGVYLTDMQNTHCCEWPVSWYMEAVEFRVDGVDDETREALEAELNTTAWEDRGYMHRSNVEDISAFKDAEIEYDDEAENLMSAMWDAAMEAFHSNPWI